MDLSQVNSIVRAEDAGSMLRPVHGYGSVVTFEGNADLIATQLRLLPISSKILILNSLLDAIPRFAAGSKFEAPSFVAHVHKVFAARAATARSFLENSTEEHPRLVLMNGGSMSAKAACLEKICEKVTSGDLVEAEAVYEDIVRSCGLDNMAPAFISAYPELILSRQLSPTTSDFVQQPLRYKAEKSDEDYAHAARNFIQSQDSGHERFESQKSQLPYQKDPGFVAMRAASLLDRAAASLHSYQNFESRSERDMATLRTSIDTSVWGLSRAGTVLSRAGTVKTLSDGPSDMCSLMSRGRTLTRQTLRDRRMGKRQSSLDSNLISINLGHASLKLAQTPTSPTTKSHSHEPLYELSGPRSADSRLRWTRYSEASTISSQKELNSLLRSKSYRDATSDPPTPAMVEFGEARLVSVASSRNLKRTSSVDEIFTIPKLPHLTNLASSAVLRHSYSTMCLRGEPPTFADGSRPPPLPSVANQLRKVTVRASKRSLDKYTENHSVELESNKAGMVDRGCSPVRFGSGAEKNQAASPTRIEPLSPTVEDLIIHVDDGHRNRILEAIMNGYRNNTNTLSAQSSPKIDVRPPSSNAFCKSTSVTRPPNPIQQNSNITAEYRYSAQKPSFAHSETRLPRDGSTRTQSSSEKDYSQITTNATPPTPASTPPPVPQSSQQLIKLSDLGIIEPSPSKMRTSNPKISQLAKLEDFGIVNSNSIETQNSLRTALAKHFPAKHGYNQYPVKNEFPDRLWRPVFEDGEETLHDSTSRQTMDQILALGCDDFVERGVWTNVLARVESLGMLKDGRTVGKFDMQYLMTTAMETFTTLPLSNQARQASNPFTSPEKVAKLFVPHLERYLSSNHSVRFLIITFPSSSLDSMVALRNLLGAETMKVAMVSNPRSSTPIPSVSSSSALNKLNNEAAVALNSRKRVPLSRLGNSKAQALLGNEQIPKPLGLKKSSNGLLQVGRSSLDDQDSQSLPDFTLEITSGQDSELVERDIDNLVHKIRTVLIGKDSIYGCAVPPSPHFAIANWSAATASGGSHSPNSSTSSSRSKGRKLSKVASMDSAISPATFGRSRGHEVHNNGGPSRRESPAQNRSPQHLDTRAASNRASRESGEWQKMYLAMGEEEFSLRTPHRAANSPQPSANHFTESRKAISPENQKRSDSRATSHLESDSEEEEEDTDDEEELRMFLPRHGRGHGGVGGRLGSGFPVRRDIGKALRMLGIA